MKFAKNRHWTLPLALSNTWHKYKLGEEQAAERDLGMLVGSRLSMSHQGKPHQELHQTRHRQLAHYPAVLSTGTAFPGAL